MLLLTLPTLPAVTGFPDLGLGGAAGTITLPFGPLLGLAAAAAVLVLVAFTLAVRATFLLGHVRLRADTAGVLAERLQGLFAAGGGSVVFWPAGKQGTPRVMGDMAMPFADGAGEWAAIRARFAPASGEEIDRALVALATDGLSFALSTSLANGDRLDARGARVNGNNGRLLGHALWLDDAAAARMREAALEASLLSANSLFLQSLELAERAPFPIWRRGSALGLEWVNRAYGSAVELPPAEVVAGAGVEFASRAIGPRARELAATACARGRMAQEKRFVVVAGQRRAFDIIEVPLPAGGTVGYALDITALDEARTDLARHVDGHAETLDRLGTAIAIFGADKRLAFHNSAFVRLWGLSEDWLEGHPHDSEILERLRDQRLLPEQADFPAWKRQRLALYTAVIEPREEYWHLPDGRTLREVCQPHPFGGLLFFYEDVSDRLALERSHNTLIAVQGATLDKLYEGVAVFGSDGRLKLCNPALGRIWKLSTAQLQGSPHIADVTEMVRPLLPGDVADWPKVRARMIEVVTEREAGAGRMHRPDGSVVDFAASHLPDGAMLLTYLDVTDSVDIERALRERNEALEAADQLKTTFVSNVSYELRTPLNSILGFGEILDQEYFGPINPRQREYTAGILSASRLLQNLINDILDLATIEAGVMEIASQRLVVSELLESVVHLMAEQGRQHLVTIELACGVPIDEAIEADERRLRQSLVNLVSNAIKYTLAGGTITLGADRDAAGINIWVADTGIGIDPRLHETVFEIFETAGERRRGAGLGLSLVRRLIALHGGEVRIESEMGAGTRVVCSLPLPALDPDLRLDLLSH